MLKLIFCGIYSCIMLNSCVTSNNNHHQKNETIDKLNISNRENAENKIIFLTLNVTVADSIQDTYNFKVVNTVLADGSLKKGSLPDQQVLEQNYFYCEIADENKKRQELIKVQNPLLKVYEYSPNKEVLEKIVFKNMTGDFTIRFQFNKNSKYLTIYKLQPDLRTLKKVYYAQI